MTTFTAAETRLLRYCVTLAASLLARDSPEMPIRPALPPLLDRIDDMLSASRWRNENCESGAAREQSNTTDLIDTAQAAAILGRTPRRVQQIADDLGGRKIGGRYAFQRGAVDDYAKDKRR